MLSGGTTRRNAICQKNHYGRKEWVIPANLKYFDIVHDFDHEEAVTYETLSLR